MREGLLPAQPRVGLGGVKGVGVGLEGQQGVVAPQYRADVLLVPSHPLHLRRHRRGSASP